MKLRPDIFYQATGLEFFNFAVENARAEDYLAIDRWVRQQDTRPTLLVVGLDVEALHNDDVAEEQLLANRELQRALTGREDQWRRFWIYKRALTPTYFVDTLESLRRWIARENRSGYILEPDGLLRNHDIEAQRALGTFDFTRESATCFEVYVARFQGMTALSSARKRDLEQLIAEQRANGGRAIVWITPLHPATVQRLEARTAYGDVLGKTRAYLDQLRANPDVETFDFSEPPQDGGSLTEWDDCAHTDDAESRRIAGALVPR